MIIPNRQLQLQIVLRKEILPYRRQSWIYMKCKICNKKFELLKENRYMVTNENLKEISKIGLSNVFEAFDCPYCGCQNIVGNRYMNIDRAYGK